MRLSELQQRLDRGEAQLASLGRAAIYSEIVNYEATGERVLEVGPAGGDLDEIMQLVPMIEETAREWGVTQIVVNAGRTGWQRLLAQHGYEVSHIVLRKILE